MSGQNLLITGNYCGFGPNLAGDSAAPYRAGQGPNVYPMTSVWQVGVRTPS
ncbi:hypothetical protein [Hymenobacter terrenus]|uniref:hypothetical protein n=1 Tax=Hymenobacter terrenus TaxID=1629124 RepID=UPI0018CFDE80|nr:hypothetical protein [Hymenobacter terrenus]